MAKNAKNILGDVWAWNVEICSRNAHGDDDDGDGFGGDDHGDKNYDGDDDQSWSSLQARLTYSTDCIWQGHKVNIFDQHIKIDEDVSDFADDYDNGDDAILTRMYTVNILVIVIII